eukprot:363087-Chlamydomonas_euryale.AAC.2
MAPTAAATATAVTAVGLSAMMAPPPPALLLHLRAATTSHTRPPGTSAYMTRLGIAAAAALVAASAAGLLLLRMRRRATAPARTSSVKADAAPVVSPSNASDADSFASVPACSTPSSRRQSCGSSAAVHNPVRSAAVMLRSVSDMGCGYAQSHSSTSAQEDKLLAMAAPVGPAACGNCSKANTAAGIGAANVTGTTHEILETVSCMVPAVQHAAAHSSPAPSSSLMPEAALCTTAAPSAASGSGKFAAGLQSTVRRLATAQLSANGSVDHVEMAALLLYQGYRVKVGHQGICAHGAVPPTPLVR